MFIKDGDFFKDCERVFVIKLIIVVIKVFLLCVRRIFGRFVGVVFDFFNNSFYRRKS